MAWATIKETPLLSLMQKLAKLNAVLAELVIKQKTTRAMRQIMMARQPRNKNGQH